MKKLLIILCITLVSPWLMNAQDSIALQKNPVLTEKFFLYAGAFAPLKQVKFGFSGNIPTPYQDLIDIDKTLNLEGIQPTLTAHFGWRFSPKWIFNTDYFSLRTRNVAVLQEDISWKKYTLKKGSTVEGGYGIWLLKVGFGRVISRGIKHELKGLIGLYFLGVNGFLSGAAFLNDKEVMLDRSQISVTLPLPSIGASYLYAPTKKFAVMAKVEWFGIKIDNIDGSLWGLSPGIQYQFSNYLGAQLTYKYLKLNGNVDNTLWNGSFELQFNGPSLGMTASF